MTAPKTLLQLAGADLSPARVRDGCLVLIDLQNEYLAGPIAVTGASQAIAAAARLLSEARSCGVPVIHVAHKGRPDSLFDRSTARGAIVDPLARRDGYRKGSAERVRWHGFAWPAVGDGPQEYRSSAS